MLKSYDISFCLGPAKTRVPLYHWPTVTGGYRALSLEVRSMDVLRPLILTSCMAANRVDSGPWDVRLQNTWQINWCENDRGYALLCNFSWLINLKHIPHTYIYIYTFIFIFIFIACNPLILTIDLIYPDPQHPIRTIEPWRWQRGPFGTPSMNDGIHDILVQLMNDIFCPWIWMDMAHYTSWVGLFSQKKRLVFQPSIFQKLC